LEAKKKSGNGFRNCSKYEKVSVIGLSKVSRGLGRNERRGETKIIRVSILTVFIDLTCKIDLGYKGDEL
jgi:hypothetical protein